MQVVSWMVTKVPFYVNCAGGEMHFNLIVRRGASCQLNMNNFLPFSQNDLAGKIFCCFLRDEKLPQRPSSE